MAQQELYFIALIPSEPLKSEVTSIKKGIEQNYQSKASLKSPPHITLHMPFQWKSKKFEVIEQTLLELASKTQPFTVELDNFSAFPPKVIYIDVQGNESLDALKKAMAEASLQTWKLFDRVETRPFHPHMTVAFRDLKKVEFYKAWELYKDKSFKKQFIADGFTLLKHNGKFWEEFMNFKFKDNISGSLDG